MWYNTNSFIPFKRKVFEIDFQHSTEINFSDYIRGKGYFKFLLGQMSEVYTEFNEVKEKLFDLIPRCRGRTKCKNNLLNTKKLREAIASPKEKYYNVSFFWNKYLFIFLVDVFGNSSVKIL
jgi:hypothetical protein